jgi:purine nucleoside phosphorylase
MRLGLLTGTGTYTLPGAGEAQLETATTPFGEVELTRSELAGVDVLHVSRHGVGHRRLSNHVNHRANITALKQLGADAVLGVTVCGAIDPTLPLGSLVVFDDLHFPINRLPDGSLCTLYTEPGDPARGHWIYESPFSEGARQVLIAGCTDAGAPVRERGCYGHVDGPRFNTRPEIRSLALAGVTAVSQTAGPETVLAGEAELPYALLGYVTDYATGASDEATPVEELRRLIAVTSDAVGSVVAAALARLADAEAAPTGVIYGFE